MDPNQPENNEPEQPEKVPLMKTAEGRMILYVVPVALVLLVIALVASQCTGG